MGQEASKARRGHYGVKLVRGPFVRLPPHPEECEGREEFLSYAARLRMDGQHLAADLFSGAGGLSLGLEAAGYRVVLSVDRDPEAAETHRHHFGGMTLDWDLGKPDRVMEVAQLVSSAGVELLAGGPPCQPFSRAGRNKIRHRVRHGFADPSEERRDLWRSFLEVVKIAMPPAVLMENVPDMALDQEMFILRTMVHELESLGYAVEERVVDTSLYGVPQFRQRLILVALRDSIAFAWPIEVPDKVTVWNAIGDLPSVEGGWRPKGGASGWSDYEWPKTEFQRRMREGMDGAEERKVYDHITRPVREDDEQRYRDDIFDDKYKRLTENGLSRTITAHIAKDGYWYIHPRDNRTLTVREAARLQTFPDRYRFAGPPSAAFRQIGNAVPPVLGEHLGKAIIECLTTQQPSGPSTRKIAGTVAEWYRSLQHPTLPWLRATSRWQAICADILLDRLSNQQIRLMWPLIARWDMPYDTAESAGELREMASWIDREARAEKVLELARQFKDTPEVLSGDQNIRRALAKNEAIASLAILAVPTGADDDSEEPVLVGRGVLRVVARFNGEKVLQRRNRMSDGRLAVARMIGYGTNAREAQLGLIELAASLCRPEVPLCERCPLDSMCTESKKQHHQSILF
jgi:DNA (cytosine-5)-methyltransferase 1